MVTANDGLKIPLRALIDQGGEASAITETDTQMLKLKRKKCVINIDYLDTIEKQWLCNIQNPFLQFNIFY